MKYEPCSKCYLLVALFVSFSAATLFSDTLFSNNSRAEQFFPGTGETVEERHDDLELTIDPSHGGHEPPRLPPPENAKPMPEPDLVWIDAKKKHVYVDGYIALREGMLEMLACPVGTKEHESIVAVSTRAQVVHAALLAIGAETGETVRFHPEFRPAKGTEVEIEIRWKDEEEEWQSTRAQEWVKDVRTDKPMKYPWVFAGSGFWTDEESGREFYMAEAGDLICVSNFTTATLDLPVESSQANDGLLFTAYTEKIPPLGTPVRIVLKPKLDKEAPANAKGD